MPEARALWQRRFEVGDCGDAQRADRIMNPRAFGRGDRIAAALATRKLVLRCHVLCLPRRGRQEASASAYGRGARRELAHVPGLCPGAPGICPCPQTTCRPRVCGSFSAGAPAAAVCELSRRLESTRLGGSPVVRGEMAVAPRGASDRGRPAGGGAGRHKPQTTLRAWAPECLIGPRHFGKYLSGVWGVRISNRAGSGGVGDVRVRPVRDDPHRRSPGWPRDTDRDRLRGRRDRRSVLGHTAPALVGHRGTGRPRGGRRGRASMGERARRRPGAASRISLRRERRRALRTRTGAVQRGKNPHPTLVEQRFDYARSRY
jgi:hypothetical protein